MPEIRRFPLPWSVEELDACFVVTLARSPTRSEAMETIPVAMTKAKIGRYFRQPVDRASPAESACCISTMDVSCYYFSKV